LKKINPGSITLNHIRLATTNDAPAILSIYAPFCEQTHVSFETAAPSVEEMAQRISTHTERYPWLVCEQEDGICGYVYASQHNERAADRWSVDVAAYMHPDSRGKGFGKILYSVLFEILRLQGFFMAYAIIALPNPTSLGLHKWLGFKQVGVCHSAGYKQGAWHDVSWWEMPLQPRVDSPVEPKWIWEVIDTERWQDAITGGEQLLEEKMKN
jgi:L-amino acid N-acyltransferase YncA